MQITAGFILTSTSSLDDSIFQQSIIFITEKNEQGTIGFVINKLFPKTLNQLEEFKHSLPFPLYNGGPVGTESLFFIHTRPDLIEGGTPIINGMYVGGNFKQAVHHINQKNILVQHIKLFIGYCGWDAGELEAEIAEGSWKVMDEISGTVEIVFAI
ncbi:MAG: YqgE/AlgH family protein [Chitinophagaceae bacterium]|nr:YqgE/AlgH family protein [Chitinophagaceae bacterium]